MTRKIYIQLVGENICVAANILDDENKDLCDQLWDCLPTKTLLMHTFVSGSNLYARFPQPKITQAKNIKLKGRLGSDAGSIFFGSTGLGGDIFIKYGQDSEDHAYPLVAKVIEEDLDKLKKIGRLCWESNYENNLPLYITVSKQPSDLSSSSEIFKNLISPETVSSAIVQELINDLNSEIRKIWLQPPQEILDTYNGDKSKITNLGSFKQYFSTLVFCEGEVRHLSGVFSYGVFDSLLKMAYSSEISLDNLELIYKTMVPGPAKFVSFCGLNSFYEFVYRALESFRYLKNKDEFIALFSSLRLYGNQVHTWNLQQFPWKVGKHLTY